jgi:hypothetical protein
MRPWVFWPLSCCLILGGTALCPPRACPQAGTRPAGPAADKPRLELADEKLPLEEIRPLDRRVFVLALEGTWKQPPVSGVARYVNLFFPDGGSYSHRVLNEELARAGEIRVLLPEYQLIRHGVARGGTITVVVSAGRSVSSAAAPEVVSTPLAVGWPLDRPIVRLPPPTRHTPRPEIDAFPLPGGMPAPARKGPPIPPGGVVPPPPPTNETPPPPKGDKGKKGRPESEPGRQSPDKE